MPKPKTATPPADDDLRVIIVPTDMEHAEERMGRAVAIILKIIDRLEREGKAA